MAASDLDVKEKKAHDKVWIDPGQLLGRVSGYSVT